MVSWSPMSCCRDAVATGPPSTSARRPTTAPTSSGSRLYECNSLLAVLLLQPHRHFLVATENSCPGPPVRRGRWWQYIEVGSSCNLTAWNAMTLLVRNKNVTFIKACCCWWRIGINKVQFVVVTPRYLAWLRLNRFDTQNNQLILFLGFYCQSILAPNAWPLFFFSELIPN